MVIMMMNFVVGAGQSSQSSILLCIKLLNVGGVLLDIKEPFLVYRCQYLSGIKSLFLSLCPWLWNSLLS